MKTKTDYNWAGKNIPGTLNNREHTFRVFHAFLGDYRVWPKHPEFDRIAEMCHNLIFKKFDEEYTPDNGIKYNVNLLISGLKNGVMNHQVRDAIKCGVVSLNDFPSE